MDWLIDGSTYRAGIDLDPDSGDLVMDNGLVRRVIRTRNGCATTGYERLGIDRALIRAVRPEAEITVDGVTVPVGGLAPGDAPENYLDPDDLARRGPLPGAYRLVGVETGPTRERFAWRKRTEWMPRDLPWPPPGRAAVLRFEPPDRVDAARGPALLTERFTESLGERWRVHTTTAHPRAAFDNEGKVGEIMAPPDTCVFAEHPLDAAMAEVEVRVDLGDDHSGGSWGPGFALLADGRAVATLVACSDTRQVEFSGADGATRRTGKLDRGRPVRLRALISRTEVRFEVGLHDGVVVGVGSVALDRRPDTIRIGRVGRAGSGEDSADAPVMAPSEVPSRVHVTDLRVHTALEGDDQVLALPEIEVHYELYDGVPVLSTWLTVINTTDRPLVVDHLVAEILAVVEHESRVSDRGDWAFPYPYLHVETDLACGGDADQRVADRAVHWGPDPDYETQVNYSRTTPCLLRCGPDRGPGVELAPGERLESHRVFELALDVDDRERSGLARRRMYRTIAPWVTQNPMLMHVRDAADDHVRTAIDQCAEVGFEMVIMTFGSGFDIETTDEAELDRYARLVDYARSKGIALGGYALLGSRGAATSADNTQGVPATFGVMPCLGSQWGHDHLLRIRDVLARTGMEVFEHDGSYPGDECDSAEHPYHRGLDDSRWVQWRAIGELYRWCLANGVTTHVPDWYLLSGVTKMYLGYRETNWSLPRRHQEIIERQNIFDGTWAKTPSMGWMFVPLTEYHGGGAAATIEPLADHLDHYDRRLANLFGSGIQACYRGPRLYDTAETRAVVERWVGFYRRHRSVLDGDIIHLRRADGRALDHILHVDPGGDEPGLLMVHNPTDQVVRREVAVPLYYTGLRGSVTVTANDRDSTTLRLTDDHQARVAVEVPRHGYAWYVFTPDR